MKHKVIDQIINKYDDFPASEQTLADFFLKNRKKINFSLRNIAKINYVSEATVSRFSQRLGYRGYREFVFMYEQFIEQKNIYFDEPTQNVISTYNNLINSTHNLINEKQIERIVSILNESHYVYIYGKGSSSLTAREFEMRFIRLGLHVEAVTDTHLMKMNGILMNDKSVLIVISMSGNNLLNHLENAKNHNAKAIIITSYPTKKIKEVTDEVLAVGSIKDLSIGNVITPQLPALLILDIIYVNFLNNNYTKRQKFLDNSLK